MSYLFPILATLLWGGNTIVTKLSAGLISPVEISFYRWTLAVFVLAPFAFQTMRSNQQEIKDNLHRLIVLGLLGGVVFQCLAYYAAQYTSAVNMGIVQSLMPVIAPVMALALLGHRIGRASLIGALLSGIGVVVVVSNGSLTALLSKGFNIGDGLMLIGTCAFALYSLLLQKWKIRIPLVSSVFIQASVASIALLPAYLGSPKHEINWDIGFYIAFAGLAASVLAPLTWMIGVSKIGASRAALFFNLTPISTAILAVLILCENMTISVITGGALAIAGVVVAEFRKPKILATQ